MTTESKEYITFEEAKEGYKKMMKVVKRLLGDAELNLENGRYSSSLSLTILALEELAKADYFRLKIGEKKGLTKSEWNKLTLGGSHDFKLNYFLDRKKVRVEKMTDENVRELSQLAVKFGVPITYNNKDELKLEIEMFKKIIAKFNLIKQECFYTNWDAKNRKWNYFESRFSDKVKLAISEYLFLEAKKDYYNEKFALELPAKPFQAFNSEDWVKVEKSENRIELAKAHQKLMKKVRINLQLIRDTLSELE